MSGVSLGSTSQVNGSGVKDASNRAELARQVQLGDQKKKKKTTPDIPNAMTKPANTNGAGIGSDIPSQNKNFNELSHLIDSAVPRQVQEGLGTILMASVSAAILAGTLGVPDFGGLGEFFAEAADTMAELPSDIAELVNEVA